MVGPRDEADEELRRALIDLMQAQSAYARSYRAWKSAPEPTLAETYFSSMREAEQRADDARREATFAEHRAALRVHIEWHDG